MEYSVFDLMKILLKKWYVILLAVCAVAVASWFLSQESYELALKQYEEYTSQLEEMPDGAGVLTAQYQFAVDTDNDTFLLALAERYADQDGLSINSVEQLAEFALVSVEPRLERLIKDPTLIDKIQTNYALAKGVLASDPSVPVMSEHLVLKYDGYACYTATISGLAEADALEVLMHCSLVLNQLCDSPVMKIYVHQLEKNFELLDPEFTDSAELSQTIMKEPVQKPSRVRTIGMAVIVSFVLTCICILCVTFVVESRRLNKKNAESANRK